MLKTILNLFIKYIKVMAIMFLLFIGLKAVGYMMPNNMIRNHIETSINQITEEGVYPKVFYNTDTVFFGQQMDNHTDSIFLNVAYSFGEYSTIERVAGDFRIENPNAKNEVEHLKMGILEGGETLSYARQWFGSMFILRILLMFFTYPEIRILSQIFFILLLYMVSNLIRKKIDSITSIAFFVSIVLGNLPVIAASFNIANAFYVVLFSTILVLYFYPKTQDAALYMFIVGGVTCYFDLFVIPLITYVFIMGMILIIDHKNNQNKEFLSYLKTAVQGSAGWIMGYILLWSTKWVFASIVLKESLHDDVLNEILKMSSKGTVSWAPTSKFKLIQASVFNNLENIFPNNIIYTMKNRFGWSAIIIVFLAVVFLTIILIMGIKSNSKNIIFILLIIAMAPYVWYVVIHTHSFVHFWMTYRLQCGTAFLLLSALGYSLKEVTFLPKKKKVKL